MASAQVTHRMYRWLIHFSLHSACRSHLGLRAGKHKGNSSKVSRASRLRPGRARLGQPSLDQLEGQAGATGPPRRLRRFRRQAAIINLDSTAATVTPSIPTGATVPTQGSRSRTSNAARRSSAAASANFQVVVERLDDEGGVALLTRRLEEEAQRSRARRCEALYEAAVASPGFFVRVANPDAEELTRRQTRHAERRTASSPSSPLSSASAWRVELSERRANSSRGMVRRVERGVGEEVGETSGSQVEVKGRATTDTVALPCRAATAAGSSSGSRRLFSRISVPVPAYQPVATCSPPLGAPGEGPLIPAGFEPLTQTSTMLPTSPPPAYASVDCLPVLEQVEVEGPMSRSW